MEQLSGTWADLFAWAAVLACVAACAGIVTRIGGHRRAPPLVIEVTPVSEIAEPSRTDALGRLDPAQEWTLVIRHATRHVERGLGLATLQLEAKLKTAAAEHAYNRLVADCAMLRRISATPTVGPTHEIVDASGGLPYGRERASESRRLAA
jgi:hypothetical protein